MSARNILTITWHEYLTNLLRPGFLFFTFLIPALGLIGVIVAGFFSGQAMTFLENQFGGDRPAPGLVDQSGLFTPLPEGFDDDYVVFAAEPAARQALLAGQISGYFVIPPDYLETGNLTAYTIGSIFDAATSFDSDNLRPLLVHGLLEGRVDDAVLERAADPSNLTPITLNEAGQPTSGTDIGSAIASFVIPYVLSIFLIISIFTASSYLLRSVSEEKETRVIEVVLSSVSASELLAGKVLGLGALGMTQVLVWIGSTFLLTGGLGAVVAGAAVVLSPRIFILSVVYFLLGFLLYGTLMAAAGALGTNMRESQQMAGLFTFGAAVPMMFNSLILAAPNSAISRALSYFPLTAPTTMMLRLPITNVSTLDLAISLGVLALSIPVVLWAGAKVFRMGLLLYGKRPGVAQIWRALRQA